jgi:hypothetical protein
VATKTGPACLFAEIRRRAPTDRATGIGRCGHARRIVLIASTMHALSVRLSGKRLYIADLAGRLEAMENGATQMNALAYRLYARRMATAMDGYPPGLLAAQLGRTHPSVLHAIESRQFEAARALNGPRAKSAAVAMAALLRHLHRQRRAAP